MDIERLLEDDSLSDFYKKIATEDEYRKIIAFCERLIPIKKAERQNAYIIGCVINDLQAFVTTFHDGEYAGDHVEILMAKLGKDNYYRCTRTADRFSGYAEELFFIPIQVQHYVTSHSHNPAMVDDIVSLASEGTDVTWEIFNSDILPKYAALEPPTSEPSAASAAESEPAANDSSDAKPVVGSTLSDDDPDPWDAQEPPVTKADLLPAPKKMTEIEAHKASIIQDLITHISAHIRSVDAFHRTNGVVKTKWFHKFDEGMNAALEGIRDWKAEEIRFQKASQRT